jgi:hypothetical protein
MLNQSMAGDDEGTESPSDELEEVKSVLAAEVRDAVAYIDLEIGPERAVATQYYKGEPYGDEEDGRSQVVTTEVRDTVQAMMPSLMRVFFGDQQVVEVIPTSGDKAAFAEQAEDTLRYVLNSQNDGFKEFYSAFKDGLVRKTGLIKWWWEEGHQCRVRTFDNVTQQQLLETIHTFGQDAVEVLEQSTQMTQQQGPQGVQQVPVSVYKIRVTERKRKPHAKFKSLPPEELLINRGAVSIETARFVCHRSMKTRAELLEMGIDESYVDEAGATGTTGLDWNRETRVRQPGLYSAYTTASASNDEDEQRYEHYECYYRHDLNGDGHRYLYRFQLLGPALEMISDPEPVESINIAEFCPDPEPHVWAGMSIADRTMDLQIINSHVVRNMLDSLAASIFPRMAYVEGQVNVDDVLNTEIGAAIRMRAPGMVQPMQVPFTGQQAMPILEYLQDLREQRTGISKAAMGLDADALQSTSAIAANATITASQAMIELIARLYAEGFRKVCRGLLRLLVTHQDRPMVVRLRSKQYVDINPQDWDPDMDVTIDVAVGLHSQQDRAQRLSSVIDKMEGVIKAFGPQNPLVSPVELNNAYSRLTELLGFKDTQKYWLNTQQQLAQAAQQPQQPPKPSPEELLAQTEKYKADLKAKQESEALQVQRERMFLEDDQRREAVEVNAKLTALEIEAKYKQAADMKSVDALIATHRNQAAHLSAQAQMVSAQQPPQQGPQQ